MKIFSANQIREWDQYTISHEPIPSLNLMERAAVACTSWILEHEAKDAGFHIFCGSGNNGGDGLAIARMLKEKGKEVWIYLTAIEGSEDFNANLARARSAGLTVTSIRTKEDLPTPAQPCIIIDALFGTGLNRPVSGTAAELIAHINQLRTKVISIDLPSGMFADQSSIGQPVIKADITLSFQVPKRSFFFADHAAFTGTWIILEIGLHRAFYDATPAAEICTDENEIKKILRPRNRFANKGTYGHAALLAGSYGMMGAAILSARACLRSGAGKLTCFIPKSANTIMQLAVPEAVLHIDENETRISGFEANASFQSVGIGPGIGQFPEHRELLRKLFRKRQPLVIDADALNMMSTHQELLREVPPNSILTPHPKELERLFGASVDDFARIRLARERAMALDLIIVLKGHYTYIAFPDGNAVFNTTGNAGMAKAGSGDVLTGLLTGLTARGYPPRDAAVLGVYLHGLAGDLAKNEVGEEAMQASDLVDFLPKAFLSLPATSRF